MTKSTSILLSIALFLFGVIIGFIFAPIKKGIYCGNNNGNNNTRNNADIFHAKDITARHRKPEKKD